MTQEEKNNAAECYVNSIRRSSQYRHVRMKDFIAGLNHAESTHSKDIKELISALKILKIRFELTGGSLDSDVIKDAESLIQKHSSNT